MWPFNSKKTDEPKFEYSCSICGGTGKSDQEITGPATHILCAIQDASKKEKEREQINLIKKAIIELKQEGKL